MERIRKDTSVMSARNLPEGLRKTIKNFGQDTLCPS
jgi:hypothetical protein